MPWSRGSLLVALLALHIPFAKADTVIVDTTADDSNASTCSLRDAVTYLNIPAATRPASHGNGCAREGDATDSNVIKLPYNKAAYIVDGVIEIDSSISISGETSTDAEPRNPVVWVKSNQAIRVDGPPLTADLGSTSTFLELDATSDSGVSDSDRHTYISLPSFSGAGAAPSSLVCLYAKKADQSLGDYLLIARANSDGAGDWTIRSSVVLDTGVYDIADVPESGGGCVTPTVAPTQVLKVSIYEPTAASITQLDFVGCGAPLAKLPAHIKDAGVTPGTCSGNKGGIFYANELLALESVVVRGGSADQGGITYIGSEGFLSVLASSLLQGRATEGSAIYIEHGGVLQLNRAVVAENAGGTDAVHFATGAATSVATSLIQNTTMHANEGYALLLQDRVFLNAVTVIGNSNGAINFGISDLSSSTSQVDIFNSIISGECTSVTWPAAAEDSPSFNLSDSSCTFPPGQNTISDASLLAVVASDGSCQGDVSGILCPRDKDADGVYDYFTPRFLPSVTQGTGDYSDIINKGSFESAISVCPAVDQRDVKRGAAGRCDIGAVEFQYVSGSLAAGGVLVSERYEQLFSVDLLEGGDEELFLPLDPTVCPVVLPTAPLVGLAAGCPWLSLSPTKGTVRLTSDRKGYIYEAASSFHGFDTFRIELTTTASRLNDDTHATSQTRSINVTAINEPTSGIESSSVLDGGSIDWLALCGLVALLSLRRPRQEATRV